MVQQVRTTEPTDVHTDVSPRLEIGEKRKLLYIDDEPQALLSAETERANPILVKSGDRGGCATTGTTKAFEHSRQHGELQYHNGVWTLTDTSTSGTWMDGKYVGRNASQPLLIEA